jgi:hypothetical protein
MKTTPIALVILSSALALGSGCATCHSHSTTWEYKVVPSFPDFKQREAAFNDLGKDGWVFVAAGQDGAYYFKRAKK